MKKNKWILLFIVFTMFFGCGEKEVLPEVNKDNCQIEKIKQIKGKPNREKFAGQCPRQINVISQTNNPKNWLELMPHAE